MSKINGNYVIGTIFAVKRDLMYIPKNSTNHDFEDVVFLHLLYTMIYKGIRFTNGIGLHTCHSLWTNPKAAISRCPRSQIEVS